MRTIIILPVVLTLLLGTSASRGQDKPVRSISVSGTAEAKTAPDQIVWRISLSDTDKNLLKAKARSDEKVKAVLRLREKLDIGEGDLETGSVSVRREYERDDQGNRGDFRHFVVRRGITIRQRDLKRLDEFLDTLISSAEMEVNFSFGSSILREVRATTRLRALRAAKDKAAAMAEVVDSKLGRVLTINEHPPGDRSQSFMGNTAFVHSTPAVDLASDKFVPGAIKVTVTVYATFELE